MHKVSHLVELKVVSRERRRARTTAHRHAKPLRYRMADPWRYVALGPPRATDTLPRLQQPRSEGGLLGGESSGARERRA